MILKFENVIKDTSSTILECVKDRYVFSSAKRKKLVEERDLCPCFTFTFCPFHR